MKKFISVSELFAKWRQDPEYVKEYEALEDEFSVAESLIEAHQHIDPSQDEVAILTNTSQSSIAIVKHLILFSIMSFCPMNIDKLLFVIDCVNNPIFIG